MVSDFIFETFMVWIFIYFGVELPPLVLIPTYNRRKGL